MIDEFKKYLKKDGKSLVTIILYTGSVEEYIEWYEKNCLPMFHSVKMKDIVEFKNYLRNSKNYKENTINSKISAIVKFNEFLVRNNL